MTSCFSAEPHFLHAIDYGNYVYFFLSEIAVEYTALGKVRHPSVCLTDCLSFVRFYWQMNVFMRHYLFIYLLKILVS